MAFPEPQAGLAISYAYLWHHEQHVGREEGVKDRPWVITNRKAADLTETSGKPTKQRETYTEKRVHSAKV